MTEVDIVRFFEDLGSKRPVKVKNFPARKESHRTYPFLPATKRSRWTDVFLSITDDRSRRGANQPKGVTGLAEFRTITDACECLILANNYPIPHECK